MEKLQKSNSIIQKHALISAGAGYIPVPIFDALGVTAVQLNMIKELADHHEDSTYSSQLTKRILSTILTSYFGKAVGVRALSLLKFIPGIGPIIGGTSVALAHSAITYAMGKTIQHHYMAGGTLENLDMKAATDHFGALFKKKAAAAQPAAETAEKAA